MKHEGSYMWMLGKWLRLLKEIADDKNTVRSQHLGFHSTLDEVKNTNIISFGDWSFGDPCCFLSILSGVLPWSLWSLGTGQTWSTCATLTWPPQVPTGWSGMGVLTQLHLQWALHVMNNISDIFGLQIAIQLSKCLGSLRWTLHGTHAKGSGPTRLTCMDHCLPCQ